MSHRLGRRRRIARFIGPVADVEAEGFHQRVGSLMTIIAGGENENSTVLHELLNHLTLCWRELALRADANDDGRAFQPLRRYLRKRQREITVAHQVHGQAHRAIRTPRFFA